MAPKPETTTTADDDDFTADVNVDTGLTTGQVTDAAERWGRNVIPTPRVPAYWVFLRQFTGFLPLLIAAAAFVSLAVEGKGDAPSLLVLMTMMTVGPE